ncbi:MAG: class I SAM-dependent methyltransferase [Nitrososphaerota archaeon]
MNYIEIGKDWVNDFFIKKGELFLEVMNLLWKRASQDTKAIDQLIKKYFQQAKDILEIMCGNGRISIHLAKIGYNVTGIDFSKIFIDDAKRKAKENNIEDKVNFVHGDVRELDKYFNKNSFDVVLSIWTSIGYFGEEEDIKIFKKVWEITKPNGLFLILNTTSRERIIKIFFPKRL